jgi:hypothetical protein
MGCTCIGLELVIDDLDRVLVVEDLDRVLVVIPVTVGEDRDVSACLPLPLPFEF